MAPQETNLYYLQSRYYDPEVGRFINADGYVTTGQGFVGNNMFAYCLNNPINHSDPSGDRVKIWPILFENHDPGFIHRAVQAHIVATELFEKELVLPGVGRADIYDHKTNEIWEIKYGGNTPQMQTSRSQAAIDQVNRYVERYTSKPLCKGHAGAFTGAFVLNCGNVSYCVTYDTPLPGVILYYVQEMKTFKPSTSVVYVPKKSEQQNFVGVLMALAFLGGGGLSKDPICQINYMR